MIYRKKTVLVLNESSKIQIFGPPESLKAKIAKAQDKEGGDNYTQVTQIYFFGIFTRTIYINVKRILYFYGK